MKLIDDIIEKAKHDKKRIVLPESMDKRVLEAAAIALRDKIADIIIIGNKKRITDNFPKYDLSMAEIIDPLESDITKEAVTMLVQLRKHKGMTEDEAIKLVTSDYMYFACLLIKLGYADGVVSGACHSTSNTLRPALQIIKMAPDHDMISAFFLMNVPNCKYGENGVFIFSDAGLVQNPSSEQLVTIAKSSAESFRLLVEKDPIVAFLSHSTKGSASHDDVDKVVSAVDLMKKLNLNFIFDGELQLDAAIIPEVANMKAPGSSVAGKANVLIFPDLDAGNIGYKLVQYLAKAEAYGPVTQGMEAPVNDLSRGCSVKDIIGVIAITAVQAQKKPR